MVRLRGGEQGATLQDDGEPLFCGGRRCCRSGLAVPYRPSTGAKGLGKEHPLILTTSDRACYNNIGKVLVVASPRKK